MGGGLLEVYVCLCMYVYDMYACVCESFFNSTVVVDFSSIRGPKTFGWMLIFNLF